MHRRRALVLGFDGLDWEMANVWIREGLLPNLRRLAEEGASGRLLSTVPPTTPPGWTSITTGVNPGKHGLFDFVRVTRADGSWNFELVNSTHKRAPELWDYVEGSIVINLPVSYPPRRINGIMVTGMLTPSREAEFTYPPEFREWILRRIPEYTFGLQWSAYGDRKEEFMQDLVKITNQKIQLFWSLFERDWRLMFFVITETDRIQHLLWGEPEMREYLARLDGFLGEVLDRVQRDGSINLFVVSDHGFGPIEKLFYVNSFLRERGYLRLRRRAGEKVLRALGLDREKLRGILFCTGLIRLYRRLSPKAREALKAALPGKSNPEYDFDLAATRAFMYGMGGIYLSASGEEREELIRELKEDLLNLRDPETGERVVEAVYRREELYSGPYVAEAPDLVVAPKPRYSVERHVRGSAIERSTLKRADHTPNGVFFALGPDVARGVSVEAVVYDVAPTVLHSLGLPVPVNVDGRVLKEVFDPSSEPAKREVAFREPARLERVAVRRAVSLAVQKALAERVRGHSGQD